MKEKLYWTHKVGGSSFTYYQLTIWYDYINTYILPTKGNYINYNIRVKLTIAAVNIFAAFLHPFLRAISAGALPL